MADITDVDGRITIPGFYDDVEDVSPAEREMIAQIPFDEEKYKQAIGVDVLFGEKGYSKRENVIVVGLLSISVVFGADIRGKEAKLYCLQRLMPRFPLVWFHTGDHAKISQMFEEYIARVTPPYVKSESYAQPWRARICLSDRLASLSSGRKGCWHRIREETVGGSSPGGSIPIISTFEQVLGIKTVLMGFGLEQNAIHSPNESQELDIFFKGIESVAEFYRLYK